MDNISGVHLIDQMRSMMTEASVSNSTPVDEKNSFGAVFQNAIQQVSTLDSHAQELASRNELGDPNVSLADAMVEIQKANIGLQGAVTVRNRLVQAYQDIMNMPV